MKTILDFVVIVLLIKIAWTDHKTMEIPDRWNLALGICGVISMFFSSHISILERGIGAFCVSVPMILLTVWIPEAFGGGDIKLTFVMGFYLGWKKVLLGTFLAIMIGGTQAFYLQVSGKARVGEGAHMAFGPALCLGFFLAARWGSIIISWYLNLFC